MNELIKGKFYDATKEIATVNPTEDVDKRLKIYKWGADNLYPNYLAALYYNCAIHSGVINSKVHYTVSAGLGYRGVNKLRFDEWFNNGNSDYNMDEVSEMLSLDLENYNAYAYTVNFVNGRVFQSNHVPFSSLRMNLDGEWEGSEDWSDKKAPVTVYKTLDPTDRTGQQLIVYMEKPLQIKLGKKNTKGIYPAPPYSGAIVAIETDIEINNYRRNEVYNNFSLGTIVNFNNGQPQTKDDKEQIVDYVRSTGQGSSNAGGVFATFNNGKDTETTVTNLTGNNLDQRYLALSKDNKENILLGHSVTNPMLFGIKTEGQLGGATELKTSYNLMKNGYFKYRQRAIATSFQYVLNKLNLVQGDVFFNEVTLDLPEEQTNTNTFNFSKEDNDPIFTALSMVGKTKEGLRVLSKREANPDDLEEEKFLKSYKTFATVTDTQLNALNLVLDGMEKEEIRRTLGVSSREINKMFTNLQENGYLDGDKITDAGTQVLAANDKIKLAVVYSYEVRPELGQPDIILGTRSFCRDLIGLNKVFTRGEIDQVSGIVDRDVWRYRGGFYHNPNTDKTTPFCRHYWQQNIILE
jgi:hypothetical protein